MARSLGGGQQSEPLLRARLAELPPASEDSEKVDEDASGRYELWRFLETGGPTGEEFADDETIDFVAAARQVEAETAGDKRAPSRRATGPGAAKASRAGTLPGGGSGRGDVTHRVARELRLNRPYLLSDVEVLVRDRAASVRDELTSAARAAWREDALGEGNEVLDLPPANVPEPKDVRHCLAAHQERDKTLVLIIEQIRASMDPKYEHPGRKPNSRDRKSQLQLNHHRLNPVDGVLEFRVNIHFALMWVPYLPDG